MLQCGLRRRCKICILRVFRKYSDRISSAQAGEGTVDMSALMIQMEEWVRDHEREREREREMLLGRQLVPGYASFGGNV